MWILWTIIIGAVVGFIARLISPAPNNPSGFILTALLGIIGSVVATLVGREVHWYEEGQSAGFIASVIGAIIVLWIWRMIERRRA